MDSQLSWVRTKDRERGKEKRVLFDIDQLHIFVGENAKAAHLRLLYTIAFIRAREKGRRLFLFLFFSLRSKQSGISATFKFK